ncbi:hypothetical protein BGZ76_007819 [Entomortierella beljakovae]|nr:hypothetical protein BGZ76_007819 [Entomortierella beljakovae]
MPIACSSFPSFPWPCGVVTDVGLTIIGFIPGILHAWWVIYQNRIDPRTHRRILPSDGERRTYVTVSQEEINDGSLPPGVKGYKVVERRVTQVPTQVVQQGQPQVQQGQTQVQQGQVTQGGSTQQYTTTTTTSSGPVRTTKTTYTTQHVVEGNSTN